jgi:hypothetical protein
MSAALFISTVSVAIALVSFGVNFWLNQRAAVRARKPVLVFVDEPEQACWVLQNVGNGPALNVLIAQRAQGQWFNPVRVPPCGKDSSFPLRWLGRINVTGLGASYSDFENRRYTSTLGNDSSCFYEGDRLPSWDNAEIKVYWQLPDEFRTEFAAALWGGQSSSFAAGPPCTG